MKKILVLFAVLMFSICSVSASNVKVIEINNCPFVEVETKLFGITQVVSLRVDMIEFVEKKDNNSIRIRFGNDCYSVNVSYDEFMEVLKKYKK